MDEWRFVFTIEGAENPKEAVTFVCSGYLGRDDGLAEFRAQADAFVEQGRNLVLDFARVTNLDSKAIGALVQLKDKVKKLGQTCNLRSSSARVTQLLRRVGLAAYLEVEEAGS
ncbi:MAG: STAS domain-containing protein [Acidobacteriaceae bacterium]